MKQLRRFLPLVVLWSAVVAVVAGAAPGQTARPKSRAVVQAPVAAPDPAFLGQYCITCHNQRLKTAGLALDTLNLAAVAPDAEVWEKVVRKIKTGMMPPSGARRPERPALDGFAAALETRLDQSAVPGANLTTPALHRLNRNEYANAIRDLLALDVNVAPLLPADASSEGFDNVAEALSVSPSLIQGYVSAAMKISRQAVGDRTLAASQITYTVPAGLAQDRHIEGLPLGTRGGMLVEHTFPLDAEYEFAIAGGGGFGGPGAGAGVDFTIDGEKIPVTNPRGFRVKVAAGPRTLGLALLDRQRGAGVDEIYSDFRANAVFTPAGGINGVTITGPFTAAGVGSTPSRDRIFVCRPGSPDPALKGTAPLDEAGCARKIVSTLARRAFRGPVAEADVEMLMKFYQQGRKDGDFETGIQQALARVLMSPRFYYRIEAEPQQVAPGATYRISDVDLASRLSFFFWSSIPDDELMDAAIKGRLHEPAVLEKQVRRMLADTKSDALIENFAGQWLYLRDLANVQTDAKNFDANLRAAFRRETELLFGSIVREDRSLIDLIDADYTFVDERLARHYGIPNVHGSYFRRVALDKDNPRRGLLGQGSMLTVTSVATRTSPVSRGKWILENLLGTPPPQPPPGVETNLDQDPKAEKPKTLRERLEMHRKNPTCAACHKIMDPMGFALENFDLVGTWRDLDEGSPIDSTGQLADGTPLKGPADLRQAVLSRSGSFMTTATEKLMVYALGRPVQYFDMPEVRAIARRAAANNNRFSSLVLGIVQSDAFQKRIKKVS